MTADSMAQSVLPMVGSRVMLLPHRSGRERAATVRSWSTGPAGLATAARVTADAAGVAELAGQRVWARAELPGGGLLVLEAVTSAASRPDELDLTGVAMLAHEQRRTAPRVTTSHPTTVQRGGDGELAAHTVDLSRTGARIALDETSGELHMAEHLELAMDVGDGAMLHVDAEVVRLDDEHDEMAVRFLGLADEDAEQIDRTVLARLSEEQRGG